jgi:hypothetical protein
MTRRHLVWKAPFSVAAVTLAVAAGAAAAAGPVEISACKTITEPGSYVLVANLSPPAPGDCLVVEADFVTIDLGGFLIRGNTEGGGTQGDGIRGGEGYWQEVGGDYSNGVTGLTIRNGTITDFHHGVEVWGRDIEIERIRALNNSYGGILVGDDQAPASAIVRDCAASGNGGHGILVIDWMAPSADSLAAVVSGNLANGNHTGIEVYHGVVSGNSATNNDHIGILVHCPSAVVGNVAIGNANGNLVWYDTFDCTFAHNAAP